MTITNGYNSNEYDSRAIIIVKFIFMMAIKNAIITLNTMMSIIICKIIVLINIYCNLSSFHILFYI